MVDFIADTNVHAAPLEGFDDDVVVDANVQAAPTENVNDDTLAELAAVGRLP
jgi:hypothetical protein